MQRCVLNHRCKYAQPCCMCKQLTLQCHQNEEQNMTLQRNIVILVSFSFFFLSEKWRGPFYQRKQRDCQAGNVHACSCRTTVCLAVKCQRRGQSNHPSRSPWHMPSVSTTDSLVLSFSGSLHGDRKRTRMSMQQQNTVDRLSQKSCFADIIWHQPGGKKRQRSTDLGDFVWIFFFFLKRFINGF